MSWVRMCVDLDYSSSNRYRPMLPAWLYRACHTKCWGTLWLCIHIDFEQPPNTEEWCHHTHPSTHRTSVWQGLRTSPPSSPGTTPSSVLWFPWNTSMPYTSDRKTYPSCTTTLYTPGKIHVHKWNDTSLHFRNRLDTPWTWQVISLFLHWVPLAVMWVQRRFLYFSFSIRRSSFSAMRARYSNISVWFYRHLRSLRFLSSTTSTGFFRATTTRVAILIMKLTMVITIISCMVDPHM